MSTDVIKPLTGKITRTVRLSYLFSGHYDAVVEELLPNPEYNSWSLFVEKQDKLNYKLAVSYADKVSGGGRSYPVMDKVSGCSQSSSVIPDSPMVKF